MSRHVGQKGWQANEYTIALDPGKREGGQRLLSQYVKKLAKLCFQCFLQSRGIYLQNAVLFFYPNFTLHMVRFCYMWARVAEVGVLAETAKYPLMLARSARLQIFATKNTVFYNCKFLQHKRRFFALTLTDLR